MGYKEPFTVTRNASGRIIGASWQGPLVDNLDNIIEHARRTYGGDIMTNQTRVERDSIAVTEATKRWPEPNGRFLPQHAAFAQGAEWALRHYGHDDLLAALEAADAWFTRGRWAGEEIDIVRAAIKRARGED